MKILISGASGLIGRQVIYKLLVAGHEVTALSRSKDSLPELPVENVHIWDDKKNAEPEWFSKVDAIINLAGENISDKNWTKSRKQRLWDSRVNGTRHIVSAVEKLSEHLRPKVLISGSAIGIYGSSSETKTEESSTGKDFLSDLCKAWEDEAKKATGLGLRTVYMRTGLVLAKNGGLLSKSAPVVLGSGNQYMSWIHIDDLVEFIISSISDEGRKGAYNLTSPNPVTNKEFTHILAKQMSIPATVKAPTIILQTVLGELSEAILADQKILPAKLIREGFSFKFLHISYALKNLLGSQPLLNNFFVARQFVPRPRKEVFQFFGNAENLELLTPPWLNFRITKMSTKNIMQGSLIDYKLQIHKIPVRWRTEISQWNPEKSFVDNQLKGPYKVWHHVHTFDDVPGGTLITDEVTYQLPAWLFGKVALPLVKKDIKEIFKFRQDKIKSIYSSQ